MFKLRKVLSVSVMALTVFVMSGMASLVSAASAQPGDLVKAAGAKTVYYLGSDSKLYNIPNEGTYFSWYKDWSGVITISVNDLNSYGTPKGFVTMRPGTNLVQRDVTTDTTVYAVEPNGMLRKIETANAIALYGSLWAKKVTKVSDQNFVSYTVGTQLPTGQYPAGTLLKKTTGADVYYFDGANYRKVATEAAFNANRFNAKYIVKTSMSFTAGGNDITGMESSLINAAQNGGTIVTPPVVTGSGLTLSLNANTPAAISVPNNGARVPMAKVNLTAANDGAISVSSITVKRIGLSTYSNIDKVWAENNGTIVASKKSMNSNDESVLTLSPALVVPAGQTVSLDLIASLTGTNAGNIGLSIASASAVSATAANVAGSFPVNGNLMSPTSYNVVDLTIDQLATTSSNVKVGDKAVDLGRFQLNTTKDVVLTSVMLKNNGTEDLTSLTNLYLEQAGNKVTSNVVVNGRFVTFTFNNGTEILKDDSNKLFYIKGDVIARENSSSNIQLSLNKSTDISGYEKATSFGFNVKYNGTSADGVVFSNRSIDAGAISITKKATSPSDTTIVKGSDNTMLLANLRTDEAITADGLKIKYTASNNSTSTNFENVRVYVNGALLDSFDLATSTTEVEKLLDSTVSLNKGDNEIKVVAKAKSDATASNITFKLYPSMFDGQNPEYVISGNSVNTTNEVGGSAAGAIFTVAGATLTAVRNDGYADNKSIVQGATDVSLGKYTLKALNDTVKVTSIALASTTGNTVNASSVSDIKVFVDGVDTGKIVDWGTSGATISGLTIEIAKDTTKNIEIKGSFDSSATGHFKNIMTITAQDSRGTTVNASSQPISAEFAVNANGSLSVAIGGNTPAAGMLASKAGVEQEVAQFKFTAVDDDASLTELNIVNTAYNASIASSSTKTDAADSRIASINLYNGLNLVDSITPVSGAGTFMISNDKAKVSANSSVTLTVKVVLNNISNDATATNKDLHFGLTTMKFKSSNGSVTNQNTNGVNGVLANNFRVRKTVPTVQLAALPTTVLTTGDNVVSKFTVSADSNGDVELNTLVFDVTHSASSSLDAVTASTTNTLKVNGSYKTVTSATYDAGTKKLTVVLASNEVISAGTSKTFEIYAATSVSGQGSESITTKISEDASYAVGVITGTSTTVPSGSFIWSDGASISVPTYSNGARVIGLTTNTQVMSK
ncbi:MAG: beta strand repeat-containing protein [Patescibacteria group bacterium]